jgi:uncharacterized protein YjbI with pentapeptide repeats
MYSSTWRNSLRYAAQTCLVTCLLATLSSADILRWDNGEPIPGTEDLTFISPGINLAGMQLEYADLEQRSFSNGNLTGTNLAFADLSTGDEYTNPNDVRGSDFSNVIAPDSDFSYAFLRNSKLTGGNFAGANFRGATAAGAIAIGANFQHASLRGANLGDVDFTNADLSHADLTNAFVMARLDGANLTGAHIQGADFYQAMSNGLTAGQMESTASFQARDLRGVNLGNNDLGDWDLHEFDLTGANFFAARLTNVDLTNSVVRDANFGLAAEGSLTPARFYSTASYQTKTLGAVDLSGNDLTGWNFASHDLRGARFYSSNLDGVDFRGADLTGAEFGYGVMGDADFSGAIIRGVLFGRADQAGFTKEQFYTTESYVSGDLTEIRYSETDLTGWNFAGKDLSGSYYDASKLALANFSGANIAGATFASATGNGFTRAMFESTASYQSAELQGVGLHDGDLQNWNFSGKNLSSAMLKWSRLQNADFQNAQLAGASFESSNLTGANFQGANVRDASFATTSQGALTKSQLQSTASYQQKVLGAIDLTGTDMRGVDFSGQQMRGARIVGSALDDASFEGADLSHAVAFANAGSNARRANFRSANLTGANLGFYDLTGADFRDATLTDAIIGPGANVQMPDVHAPRARLLGLKNSDLREINLMGGVLEGDFQNSDFTQADLSGVLFNHFGASGADFTGARIDGARFHGQFTFITEPQLRSTVNYAERNLRGIRFDSVGMQQWDLSSQDLTGARFRNGWLVQTDFSHAILNDVDMTGASLNGADLTEASFLGANLRGTSFANATIRGADLTGAVANGFYFTRLKESRSWLTERDLTGVRLGENDLRTWDFSKQLLFNADLTGSQLANAKFHFADLRGTQGADLAGAIFSNTIDPEGNITSINLPTRNDVLLVRNHLGDEARSIDPTAIHVAQSWQGDALSTVQFWFDDQPWHSTISFAPDVSLQYRGALDLRFVEGIDVIAQVGRTFQLFDWTNAPLAKGFNLASPYTWDFTQLYTTGEVTLLSEQSLPGDTNADGNVNLDDLNNVRNFFGQTYFGSGASPGDTWPFNRTVDLEDLNAVRNNFGAGSSSSVPEPGTAVLAMVAVAAVYLVRRRGS